MDLKVLISSNGTLTPSFSKEQTLVTGTQALVQEVVIELLSDYNELLNRGSGLQTVIDEGAPGETARTRSDINKAISLAKAHILSNQQSANDLSPDQVLIDLKPLSIKSESGIDWLIDIEIVTAVETVTTQLAL